MSQPVMEMMFSDMETLSIGDWVEKIKEWLEKLKKEMEFYELSSVAITISASPSATVTFSKKIEELPMGESIQVLGKIVD